VGSGGTSRKRQAHGGGSFQNFESRRRAVESASSSGGSLQRYDCFGEAPYGRNFAPPTVEGFCQRLHLGEPWGLYPLHPNLEVAQRPSPSDRELSSDERIWGHGWSVGLKRAPLCLSRLLCWTSFSSRLSRLQPVDTMHALSESPFIRIGSDTSKLASTLGSLRLRNGKSLYPQESQRIGSYVPCGV